jgi:hypothetical protein
MIDQSIKTSLFETSGGMSNKFFAMEMEQHVLFNEKESTVNIALGGSTYPG